jgi:hypothetical protein
MQSQCSQSNVLNLLESRQPKGENQIVMCWLYPIRKFTELCSEETPMVRRAVAIKIGEMAQFMEKVHVISDLIPVLK